MKSYISSLIISAQELIYIDDFSKSVGSWLSILATISEHIDLLSTSSRRQLLTICSSVIENLLKSDIDFKDQSLNSHIETYFPTVLNDVKYKNLIYL
jgi:hypothetical protein